MQGLKLVCEYVDKRRPSPNPVLPTPNPKQNKTKVININIITPIQDIFIGHSRLQEAKIHMGLRNSCSRIVLVILEK